MVPPQSRCLHSAINSTIENGELPRPKILGFREMKLFPSHFQPFQSTLGNCRFHRTSSSDIRDSLGSTAFQAIQPHQRMRILFERECDSEPHAGDLGASCPNQPTPTQRQGQRRQCSQASQRERDLGSPSLRMKRDDDEPTTIATRQQNPGSQQQQPHAKKKCKAVQVLPSSAVTVAPRSHSTGR